MTRNSSLEMFRKLAVVDYYDQTRDLHESEALLFGSYLKDATAILDIGVGAGRTTPYLSGIGAYYVGVDYSDRMIARCREKFPTLPFFWMDASDMSSFADESFDAAVFSFNGIDYLPTDGARASCILECARILRPGGVFIVSSHNARYLFFSPGLGGVSGAKKAWRLIYAAVQTFRNLLFRITSKAFWRGAGYVWDPMGCGGLTTYVSTPDRFVSELRRAGFAVVRIVEGSYPLVRPTLAVPWYYYACVKDHSRGEPRG